jgi:hypothetical protein
METQTHKVSSRSGKVAGFVSAICLIAGGLASPAVAENFGAELADAFKEGEFDVNFRYRYEFVDRESRGPLDPVTRNANASTLRTRLVFKTAEFYKTFLTLNMDDVRTIVSNNYNSTRNGRTEFPIVGDPAGTDLNLASLTFMGLEDGKIVLGRQRIIRDNARFVGNVGWRQNEQTYDSASIDYTFMEKFEVFYAYVDRVKRVFGPDDGPAPVQGSFSSNSNLIEAQYTFTPLFKLAAYAYLLDFENAPGFSSQTLGGRLTGKQEFGGNMGFNYRAEYAKQQDYKNNPANYDEGYYHLVAGFDWSKLGAKLGYEVLEGSGTAGESFQTPLATGHKFNGWADQFVVTPGTGLKDLYIEGSAKFLGGKWALIYHDFSASTGGSDYGNELDFVASWKFLKHYSVLAKYARFSADSNTPIALHSDISKAWLMLTAAF